MKVEDRISKNKYRRRGDTSKQEISTTVSIPKSRLKRKWGCVRQGSVRNKTATYASLQRPSPRGTRVSGPSASSYDQGRTAGRSIQSLWATGPPRQLLNRKDCSCVRKIRVSVLTRPSHAGAYSTATENRLLQGSDRRDCYVVGSEKATSQPSRDKVMRSNGGPTHGAPNPNHPAKSRSCSYLRDTKSTSLSHRRSSLSSRPSCLTTCNSLPLAPPDPTPPACAAHGDCPAQQRTGPACHLRSFTQ